MIFMQHVMSVCFQSANRRLLACFCRSYFTKVKWEAESKRVVSQIFVKYRSNSIPIEKAKTITKNKAGIILARKTWLCASVSVYFYSQLP